MLCTLRRGDSLEVDQASSLPDESLRPTRRQELDWPENNHWDSRRCAS